MSERIAVVTRAELALYTAIEATPEYEISQTHAPRTDPRHLPGDLINYTAGIITATEELMRLHHGLPPAKNTLQALLRSFQPSEPPLSRYTINDLHADPTKLNNPPLILETDQGALPSSEFAVTAEQHLLGFVEALFEVPEIDDKDSIENQIPYNPRGVDTASADLISERSQTGRDPLAVAISGLLRLKQLGREVFRDQGLYDREHYFDLPNSITTTTQDTRTGIITKNTRGIEAYDRHRLGLAIFEAQRAEGLQQDENNT